VTRFAETELIGSQRPATASIPKYVGSSGAEATQLAATAGLFLDDWQSWCLECSLGEREDGKWAASQVGLIVPRQNGKGSVLEARELFGLFLGEEQLIVHSAHLYATSMDAFRRILELIESTPDLKRQVRSVSNTNGKEGITLKNGCRLKFVARSKGGGRGLSADLVILDEAFALTTEQMDALIPTLSARKNPQVWYTSSPPLDAVTGEVLLQVKARGESGDPRLAWMDWGAERGVDPDDVNTWALHNPGFNIRIGMEAVQDERNALSDEGFLRERLGVWPEVAGKPVISPELWAALATTGERPSDVVFAIDVDLDRSQSSIVSAGLLPDGRVLLSVVDTRPGTAWLEDRVIGLSEKWNPLCFVIDSRSPAASLIPLGLTVADRKDPKRGQLVLMSTTDVTAGFGMLIDSVNQKRIAHLDEAPLNAAVNGAQLRTIGDSGSAWARRKSTDITPLVAATSAHWALSLRDSITTVSEPSVFWL